MLSIKKYFTEGLMQMAILLSLCGVRVEVGLESYLHEIMLGPTSLLSRTEFHNFHNRLENGLGLHPKSLDLDWNFWTETLLSWICPPNRLQIPRQEVVSWLVQQAPDPAPTEPTAPMSRVAPAAERDQSLREVGDHDGMEEEMESEQRAEDEDQARRDGGENPVVHTEPNQHEVEQSSLQECLRLLEVTFPFSEDVQFQDADAEEDLPRGASEPCHSPHPRTHTAPSPSELDLQWQDLLSIVTPQSTTSPFGQNSGDPIISHEEAPGEQGPEREVQPVLLPLIPSSQLDELSSPCEGHHSSVTHAPPDHSVLLSEGLGLSPEDPFSSLSMPENMDPAMAVSLQQYSRWSSSSPPSTAEQEEAELAELLKDAAGFLDLALEEDFSPEMVFHMEKTDDVHSKSSATQKQWLACGAQQEAEKEVDSDSGLSLDFTCSPPSPCMSSASSSSSGSSASSLSPAEGGLSSEEWSDSPEMEAEVTIKEEPEEEEIGAVGGEYPEDVKYISPDSGDQKMLWTHWVGHDHTYHHACSPAPPSKTSRSSRPGVPSEPWGSALQTRDERRARALKIPFSNELLVHLPVEEFNDLLAESHLTEEQLSMVRDIRRRGKNKIAAQNCRQRKLGVLRDLEAEVSLLRMRRMRLLRDRQEKLRNLRDLKRELGALEWELLSCHSDQQGRPMDPTRHQIHVGPGSTVGVEARRLEQSRALGNSRRKKRDKRT